MSDPQVLNDFQRIGFRNGVILSGVREFRQSETGPNRDCRILLFLSCETLHESPKVHHGTCVIMEVVARAFEQHCISFGEPHEVQWWYTVLSLGIATPAEEQGVQEVSHNARSPIGGKSRDSHQCNERICLSLHPGPSLEVLKPVWRRFSRLGSLKRT